MFKAFWPIKMVTCFKIWGFWKFLKFRSYSNSFAKQKWYPWTDTVSEVCCKQKAQESYSVPENPCMSIVLFPRKDKYWRQYSTTLYAEWSNAAHRVSRMNFVIYFISKLYCHFHTHTHTHNLPDSDLQPTHISLCTHVVVSTTPGKKRKTHRSIQVVFFLWREAEKDSTMDVHTTNPWKARPSMSPNPVLNRSWNR